MTQPFVSLAARFLGEPYYYSADKTVTIYQRDLRLLLRLARASEIIAAHHTLGLPHKEADMQKLTNAFYALNAKPRKRKGEK